MAMLQIVDTVMYLVTALVIYRFAGRSVKSPALSSAGPLMKKVCYGLAVPTVSVTVLHPPPLPLRCEDLCGLFRLLLQALYSVMWLANMSMSVFSAAPTTCIDETS